MIRVLRLMEYEFESFEIADKHLAQCSIPANGSKSFGNPGLGMIRSVILVTPFSVALDPPTDGQNARSPRITLRPEISY